MPPPRPCSKLAAPDTHPAGPCLVLRQPERNQIAALQGDCSRLHWVGLLGLSRLWLKLLAARAGPTHGALPVPLNPIRPLPPSRGHSGLLREH